MQSPSADNDKRISGSQLRQWKPLLDAWDDIHGVNDAYKLGEKMDYNPMSQALVATSYSVQDKDHTLAANFRKFGMEAEIRPIPTHNKAMAQNRYIVSSIDPGKMRLPEMTAQEKTACAERLRQAARMLRLAHALITQPIPREYVSHEAYQGLLKHAGGHKHPIKGMKEYWKEDETLQTLTMFDAMKLHDWNRTGSKDALVYIAASSDLTLLADTLTRFANAVTHTGKQTSAKELATSYKFLSSNHTMIGFIDYFLNHNGLGGSVPAIAEQTKSLLSDACEKIDKPMIEALGHMTLNLLREETLRAPAEPEQMPITTRFKPVPVRRNDTEHDYAIAAELPSPQEAQAFGAMLEQFTPYTFKTLPSATSNGTLCTMCTEEKRTLRFGDLDAAARVLKQMHQTFDMPVAGLEFAKKSVGSQHK